MLISGRQACALLAEAGVARTQGRRVRLAGLAGPATQTSSALLYDEDRVRDLAGWPVLTPGEVLRACPDGLFVARVPGRNLPDELCSGWPLSIPIRVVLRLRAAADRPLPLVATVSGFVASGAEIVGVTPEQRDARTSRLELIWPDQRWVVAGQRGTSAQ